MRGSYSGNTLAFQANAESSILLPRSKFNNVKVYMSKPVGLSRGPSINTDLCVENVGNNRFNLILIASHRAREIKRQQSESTKREHLYSNVTALLEIQEGKIGPEYLKRIR